MKYEATVSFAGNVCMNKVEVMELASSIAGPFVKCGYLKEVRAVRKKESKRNNNANHVQPHSGSGRQLK